MIAAVDTITQSFYPLFFPIYLLTVFLFLNDLLADTFSASQLIITYNIIANIIVKVNHLKEKYYTKIQFVTGDF